MRVFAVIELSDGHCTRHHLNNNTRSHDLMCCNLIKLEKILDHLLLILLNDLFLSSDTYHCGDILTADANLV